MVTHNSLGSCFLLRRAPLWLAVCVLASAPLRAQTAAPPTPLERTLSIDLRAVPLRQALDFIARSTHIRLSYSPDLVPLDRLVTLVQPEITAGAALHALLAGTAIEVSVSPSGVVTLAPRDPRALHGRVVDAVTGMPLSGVTVGLEATTTETITESDGRYSLPADDGRRLVARRFGYQTAAIVVGESKAGSALDIALAPAALSLDRLDVVGPRTALAEPDPVHAMTTLRPAELAALQPRTLGEVFRAGAAMLAPADAAPTPRLRVTGLRGATSLALSPPKVYVDGVELAQPQYVGVLDPASIERIEIVRGPQGAALYGSDAIGGVVHIITRKGTPGSDAGVEAELRSAAGTMRPALGDGGAFTVDEFVVGSYTGRRAAASAGASLLRQGTSADGGGTRVGVFGGGRAASTRAAVEVSMRLNDQTWQPKVNDVLRAHGFTALLAGLDDAQHVRQLTGGATLRLLAHDDWSHTLTTGHDRIELEVDAERMPQISPPDSLVGESRGTSDRTSLRYTSLWRLPFGELNGALLTFGGELTHLRHESEHLTRTTTRQIVDRAVAVAARTDAGMFSRIEVNLPRLLLSAGLRAEESGTFGVDHGLAWLPSAGAAYNLEFGALTTRWRIAWGRAIRPAWPSTVTGRVGVVVTPDPALAPEEQHGLETGFDIGVAGRARLRFSYFDQTVDGLIQNVPVAGRQLTFTTQNVGRIDNDGWELEATVRHAPLSLQASHTRVDSRVRHLSRTYAGELLPGDVVGEVPGSATSVTLGYEARPGSLALSGVRVGSWNSYDWIQIYSDRAAGTAKPSPRDYRITYDPLLRVDLALALRISNDIAALLKAENLTGSRRGRDNLEPAPGRSISLGVQMR